MKRMLLVEDNVDERMLVKRLLKKFDVGAELLTAEDGKIAVEMLAAMEQGELPVMILLDLKMPRMHGHQVLQWIRSHEVTRYIPVVIFSGSDDVDDMRTSYRLGANSYVQKQVNSNLDFELLSHFWINVNKPMPSI